MEGPSSSTWSSSPSASLFSHPDSVAQDVLSPPYQTLSLIPNLNILKASGISNKIEADEVMLNAVNQSGLSTIESDSLKRKRKFLASDNANLGTLTNITPELKKPKLKKQLAGPASRKKLLQNAQWKCVFCNVTFMNKGNLMAHMDKCLKCSSCQKEFCSIREKAVHEANEHISVFIDCDMKHLRKRCSRCPARYASSVMLSMHSRYDHPSSKSLADAVPLTSVENNINCSSRNSRKGSAAETLPSSDEWHCDDSGEDDDHLPLSDLKNMSKTKDHQATHIKVECSKCFRVFATLRRLESHTCYQDKIHPHYCSLCKKAFPSASVLQEHDKVTHCKSLGLSLSNSKNNNIPKPASKKKIVDQSDSILKKTLTSGLKKKVLSCHTCFAEFEDEEPFILHLYKHATEESDDESKPKKKSRKIQSAQRKKTSSVSSIEETEVPAEQFSVKCERCFVVCRSKEYYKVHLATHMSKSKTSFPCSGCCQDFRNVEALNRHTCGGKQSKDRSTCCLDCGQNLVEGEDHVCDNKCPQCDKVFKSARGQRLHYVHKHRTSTALEGNDEEHDEDQQLREDGINHDYMDDEQKSESMDSLVSEHDDALSQECTDRVDPGVNEESFPVDPQETEVNEGSLPVESQEPEVNQESLLVPAVSVGCHDHGKQKNPSAMDLSDSEASDGSNSGTASFIEERLPPDGAPLEDPVPCGTFGTFSLVSSEKKTQDLCINRNVNTVS